MSETMSVNTAKERAKERDGWECRFCETTEDEHQDEYGRGLHAHHLIKSRDGGLDHPDNLITVCETCHKILENTQADALSRIKGEHTEEVKERYQRRIDALEADLRKERNSETEMFGWFDQTTTRVHILLKGPFDPEIEFYEDRDDAAEAYAEYDGGAKMITRKVHFGETAAENFRFATTDKASVNVASNGEDYFSDSQEAGVGFWSSDIPESLQ